MLASLSELKLHLSMTTDASDEVLTQLLVAASAQVEAFLGRDILAADYLDEFDGRGLRAHMLLNSPAVSVSSVMINGREIEQSSGYGSSGWRLSGRFVLVEGGFPDGNLNCSVSYRAGYETVPAAIKQAVIDSAAHQFKELDRIGVSSKTLATETIAFRDAENHKRWAMSLNPYRSVV